MMSGKRRRTPYDIVVANRTRERPPRDFLRSIAVGTAQALGAERVTVGIVLLGEAAMRRLSMRYRGKRAAANVLAFSYAPRDRAKSGNAILEGDIALCPAVIKEEARRFGRSLRDHLALLVVHGMVHLAGYSHDSDRSAKKMERLEQKILRTVGFPGRRNVKRRISMSNQD